METVKLFMNGGSQAVRLPKSYQYNASEVLANKIGSIVILMPKDDPWSGMMESFKYFTDDFLAEGVEDLPVQEREGL